MARAAPPPDDPRPVRVAVIVPTHKQPGLLAEALDTALAQRADFRFAIAIVNDGCPFAETDRVCAEFAAAHPGSVYYLHPRNAGLSAARNAGIAFALAAFPALEAVYFLDSDNRLGPHLLQRLFDALRRAGPEIGWAYPDIDKFGFPELVDTSGPYSPLEHLFRNVSEAGSMAARRMLDAGLRFDPAMRQGYEDWEFWLQGLERGFRGVHVPDAGFGYRRRGESMLVDADRDARPILDHVRARHPGLFGLKATMRIEAAAARRYALIHPDAGTVRCLTDPDAGAEDEPLDRFLRRLLRLPERPGYGLCPGQIVILDRAVADALQARRLLGGVLWVLECALARAALVTCRVAVAPDPDLAVAWDGPCWEPAAAAAAPDDQIAALRSATLLAAVRERPLGPLPALGLPHARARLGLALDGPAGPFAARPGLALVRRTLDEIWQDDAVQGWTAAAFDRFRAAPALPRDVYREAHRLTSVLPVPAPGSGVVALVVDPAHGTAAGDLAARLAAWLGRAGLAVHLVGLGPGALRLAADRRRAFRSLVALPVAPARAQAPPDRAGAYLGTPIPPLDRDDLDAAVGTLAGFDTVIALQHSLAHALMGWLRKLDVATWAVLGIADPRAPPAEAVNACAAFEHAYQAVIALDPDTLRLCRALAIPADKLRRWGDGGGTADDADWAACPALAPPGAAAAAAA